MTLKSISKLFCQQNHSPIHEEGDLEYLKKPKTTNSINATHKRPRRQTMTEAPTCTCALVPENLLAKWTCTSLCYLSPVPICLLSAILSCSKLTRWLSNRTTPNLPTFYLHCFKTLKRKYTVKVTPLFYPCKC